MVHVTRNGEGDNDTARDRLKAILNAGKLEARSAFGLAKGDLEAKSLSVDSQKCVCFTETPLEHIHLMLQDIDDRKCHFAPYGIAITKRVARDLAINPVWYVDITPPRPPVSSWRDWLTKPLNTMITAAIDTGNFDSQPIAKITPFIEPMGRGASAGGSGGYLKEFWWEREWRKVGNLSLPVSRFIGLCPEDEIPAFQTECEGSVYAGTRFIDPRWGLEEIIGHLAGFFTKDIKIL